MRNIIPYKLFEANSSDIKRYLKDIFLELEDVGFNIYVKYEIPSSPYDEDGIYQVVIYKTENPWLSSPNKSDRFRIEDVRETILSAKSYMEECGYRMIFIETYEVKWPHNGSYAPSMLTAESGINTDLFTIQIDFKEEKIIESNSTISVSDIKNTLLDFTDNNEFVVDVQITSREGRDEIKYGYRHKYDIRIHKHPLVEYSILTTDMINSLNNLIDMFESYQFSHKVYMRNSKTRQQFDRVNIKDDRIVGWLVMDKIEINVGDKLPDITIECIDYK